MQPIYDSQNLPQMAHNLHPNHQALHHEHAQTPPHPIAQLHLHDQEIIQQHRLHHHNHQQQQQHQRLQHTQMGSKSESNQRLTPLGSKDLIIRMLAEVFQVVRNETTGQLRWHQLSSSLLPVSLYSRTTGRWLDYLTAASSLDSNQEQSAMSPDSRQFLLLLQQIHHQQQRQQQHQSQCDNQHSLDGVQLSNGCSLSNSQDGDIVFQVIAHDLIDGNQCKVILNAKLCQPGTRIGLASDYFVYWRDSGVHLSQQQQSSNLTNAPCCQNTPNRIWGLNFASVNDANLFYDICSLNLTDLDFNHEYLKQLANKNKLQISSAAQKIYNPMALSPATSMNQAQYHQATNRQRSMTQTSPSDQQFGPKCSACQDNHKALQQQSDAGHVRKKRVIRDQVPRGANVRSKSTGRVLEQRQEQQQQQQIKYNYQQPLGQTRTVSNLKRSQSLSTPTTPERLAHERQLQQQQLSNVENPEEGRYQQTANLVNKQTKKQDLTSDIRFPPSSRMATRRSTGIDMRNIEEINRNLPNCQRRARMAREQYANSKNLNEFLSLDLANTNCNGQHTFAVNHFASDIERCPQTKEQQTIGEQKSADKKDEAEKEASQWREVATTTDDLQLDSGIRKRMFHDLANNGEKNHANNQSTRSDASSRRKSLERSFGIDIDLPSVKKRAQQTTLSPLRQSETSLVSPETNQFAAKDQQTSVVKQNSLKQKKKQTSQQQQQQQQQLNDIYDAQSGIPMRHRAKSSGEATLRKLHVSTRQLQPEVDTGIKQINHRAYRLSQANSAPDVRQAFKQSYCHNHDEHNFDGNPNYAFNEHYSTRARYYQDSIEASMQDPQYCRHHRRSGPTYQAGFCGQNYAQSCPSSLRRRVINNNRTKQQPQTRRLIGNQAPTQMACNCNIQCNFPRYPDQSSFGYRNPNSTRETVNVNQNRMNLEQRLPSHYNGPYGPSPEVLNQNHHYQHQPYHYHGHNLYEYEAASPYIMSYDNQQRMPAGSSLSSRSPLNWAQYAGELDEDFDNNLDRNDMEHYGNDFHADCDQDEEYNYADGGHYHISESGRPPRGRQWTRPQSACMDAMSAPIDRSMSTYHFTQPVANYDKCLNRQALRARPRAKSQPPEDMKHQASQRSRSAVNSSSSAVLAKSMENVQKLIREVQFELNSFKRRANIGPKDNSNIYSNTIRNNQAKPRDEIAEPDLNTGQVDKQTDCKQPISRVSRPSEYKCVGAMRKAGFLWAKKWLNNIQPGTIELARGKAWRRYWVTLRGTVLLIHNICQPNMSNSIAGQHIDLLSWIKTNCADQQQLLIANLHHQWLATGAGSSNISQQHESEKQENQANILRKQQSDCDAIEEFKRVYLAQTFIECSPRHLIIIDGSIAQPMPEHPRREYVFCLSTRFGDAFLFQAPSSLETDNWILALHNACAASLARNLNRSETVKLFDSRIRDLDLEAEKLLFLRHRLESRLTSMCSISREQQQTTSKATNRSQNESGEPKSLNMRDLLSRLEDQMIELDRLLEQIHCEIYQLRCYLAACNSVCNFYSYMPKLICASRKGSINGQEDKSCKQSINDLPDPRNLLKNVSKHTKMVLLNLGVFMVSSIQAYIHARQGSAETIIRQIRLEHESATRDPKDGPLELNFLSLSLGDSELATRKEICRLDESAKKLIEISNISVITVKLTTQLYKQIIRPGSRDKPVNSGDLSGKMENEEDNNNWSAGFSIEVDRDWVCIKCEMHQSDCTMSILRKLFQILNTKRVGLKLECSEFLEYYLIVNPINNNTKISTTNISTEVNVTSIAKRTEQLKDWSENLDFLELRQRKRFQVILNRSSLDSDQDSDSIPFGLLLEAQLFSSGKKNILSVYCSFVEWRSDAESKGLIEEDEIIGINGIRTVHLDMMFIEWLMTQEKQLNLIVSSSHDIISNGDANKKLEDAPEDGDQDKANQNDDNDGGFNNNNNQHHHQILDTTNRIIDDAYVSALICPPPPANETQMTMNQLEQLATIVTEPELEQAVDLAKQPEGVQLLGAKQVDQEGPLKYGDVIKTKYNHQHPSMLRSSRSSETISRPDSDFNSDIVDLPPIEHNETVFKSNILMLGANCNLLDEEQTNKLERVRKSIMELIVTEFGYILQLEEILEFFIKPLAESNYLHIKSLKILGDFLMLLPNLHKKFLYNLVAPIDEKLSSSNIHNQQQSRQQPQVSAQTIDTSKLEYLIDQVQDKLSRVGSLISTTQCDEIIRLITDTFKAESERLKNYASYSVSYSHLQRILHPKMHALQSQHSLTNAKYEPVAQQHQTNPLDLLLKGGRNLRDSISMSSMSTDQHHDDAKVKHKLLKFLANLEKENNVNTNTNTNNNNSLSISTSSLKCSPASRSLNLDQESANNRINNNNSNSHATGTTTTSTTSTTNLASCGQIDSESILMPNKQHRSSFIHQQSFESYLIRPIQRIIRYPMLLKTILITHQEFFKPKSIGEMSDDLANVELPFETVLRETIKLMESVASHVNQVQQIYDQFGDLFELLRQEHLDSANMTNSSTSTNNNNCNNNDRSLLTGSGNLSTRRLSHQPIIELNSDHLLHFGQLNWLNSNDFVSGKMVAKNGNKNLKQMLFVFDSCVVFICHDQPSQQNTAHSGLSSSSKSSRRSMDLIRYQTLIPVSQIQVRTLSEHQRDNSEDQQTVGGENQASHRKKLFPNEHQEGFRWELICCQFKHSSEFLLQTSKKRSQANNNFAKTSINQTRDQRKGNVYLFVSKTSEERNVFLKKIRQTIRDSVSKMNLPSRQFDNKHLQDVEVTQDRDQGEYQRQKSDHDQNNTNSGNRTEALQSESHDTTISTSNNSSGKTNDTGSSISPKRIGLDHQLDRKITQVVK